MFTYCRKNLKTDSADFSPLIEESPFKTEKEDREEETTSTCLPILRQARRKSIVSIAKEMDLTGRKVDVASLCEAINTKVKSIKFCYNDLSDEDMKNLAEMLKQNSTLETLTIAWNDNITSKGFKYFASALKVNKGLRNLKLHKNKIDNDSVKSISSALKQNKTLISLNMEANNFSDEGAKWLADALQINYGLQELSLRSNKITSKGCNYIFQALSKNRGLTSLDLGFNLIDSSSVWIISEVIRTSKMITHLGLADNRLGKESSHDIFSAVESSETLIKIDLKFSGLSLDDSFNHLADRIHL